MTSPAFNEPFNSFYDEYSIRAAVLSLPYYWSIFHPDNSIDFTCLSVITPNTAKSASAWTSRGRWITLGIYRDEGRDPAVPPARSSCTWTRLGTVLTVTDPVPHGLLPGDMVAIYNVNLTAIPSAPVKLVLDQYSFTVTTQAGGSSSGSGATYQQAEVNFYETHCVFRLLPSFKLVKYSEVLQLFADTAPLQTSSQRSLYNITLAEEQAVPQGKSASVNYEVAQRRIVQTSTSELKRRFDQVYDEQGVPLPVKYDALGFPITPFHVSKATDNEHTALNQPTVNQANDRVYVYDFYGIDVNDSRGPYFVTDVITRDTTKLAPKDNIKRKQNNDVDIYSKPLYDIFGNLVLGIQENNALYIRELTLPLALDKFNHPVKLPVS